VKKYLIIGILSIVIIGMLFLFFRYFFTYEQRNRVKRSIESVTGQNLRVTVYDMNGKVLRQWEHIEKISTGGTDRHYIFFYTDGGKYVQIPDSAWYVAEEE
jgi:hypothetical protein